MLIDYQGQNNIAASDAKILVNTINCVGAMGAGVALAMKKRFPEIMPRYKEACDRKLISPGRIQVMSTNDGRLVVNLATKGDWRAPSRYEWAGASLMLMNHWLKLKNIEPCRIAIPLPGAGNGGLDPARSHFMVKTYLSEAIARGFELDIFGAAAEPAIPDDPIYYAGIGSRETPQAVLERMEEFGELASGEGWLLRSGGAVGADSAFHNGAKRAGVQSQIFLADKRKAKGGDFLYDTKDVHFNLMRVFHPRPDALKPFAAELMARNGCQLFGVDFTNPTRLVVCYTEGGAMKGGTAQALRMAQSGGIPALNFGDPKFANISATEAIEVAREMIQEREIRIGLHPVVRNSLVAEAAR